MELRRADPVVVKRHCGLDLAAAQVTRKAVGVGDLVEADTVVVDFAQLQIHGLPQPAGVGVADSVLLGRRQCFGQRIAFLLHRIEIGGEHQVGAVQPIDLLGNERVFAGERIDDGIAAWSAVVDHVVEHHKAAEVRVSITRKGAIDADLLGRR